MWSVLRPLRGSLGSLCSEEQTCQSQAALVVCSCFSVTVNKCLSTLSSDVSVSKIETVTVSASQGSGENWDAINRAFAWHQ